MGLWERPGKIRLNQLPVQHYELTSNLANFTVYLDSASWYVKPLDIFSNLVLAAMVAASTDLESISFIACSFSSFVNFRHKPKRNNSRISWAHDVVTLSLAHHIHG
jgi:hypothetical protein